MPIPTGHTGRPESSLHPPEQDRIGNKGLKIWEAPRR